MTNRTCHVCGKRYYYCSSYNCDRSRGKPRWMVMFDEENCFNIWQALSERFQKIRKAKELLTLSQITESDLTRIESVATCEAAEKLNSCDLSDLEGFVPQIRKEINEVLASPEAKRAGSPASMQDLDFSHPVIQDSEEAPKEEEAPITSEIEEMAPPKVRARKPRTRKENN